MTILCEKLETDLLISGSEFLAPVDSLSLDLSGFSITEKHSPLFADVLRIPLDPRNVGHFVAYAHTTDEHISITVADESTWRAADNPASSVFNWTNLLGYPGTDAGGAAILNLHLTASFKGRDTGRVQQAIPWQRIVKAPPYTEILKLSGISGTRIKWSDGITESVEAALFYAWAPDTKYDDNENHPQNPACMLITKL